MTALADAGRNGFNDVALAFYGAPGQDVVPATHPVHPEAASQFRLTNADAMSPHFLAQSGSCAHVPETHNWIVPVRCAMGTVFGPC